MTRSISKLVILSVSFLMLFSFLPAVSAFSVQSGTRAISDASTCPTNSCALNWSGYAYNGSAGLVTQVSGSWTVPTVTCTSKSAYAAVWVGIDGYSSDTVEQTGVLGRCSGGSASYSAWYEFYPAASVTITSIKVSAGDSISASVTYASGKYTATITDTTAGKSFSITRSDSSAVRSSAEWIVERPEICSAVSCKLSSLADYGTVTFSSISATTTSNSYSTDRITMVDSSGKVLSEPSALNNAGTSFSVTWYRSK